MLASSAVISSTDPFQPVTCGRDVWFIPVVVCFAGVDQTGNGSMPSDWSEEAGHGLSPANHSQCRDRNDGEAGECGRSPAASVIKLTHQLIFLFCVRHVFGFVPRVRRTRS